MNTVGLEIWRAGAYGCIYRCGGEVIKKSLISSDGRFFGINYPIEHDLVCRLVHPNLLAANRITSEGYLVFNYYPYTWQDETIVLLPTPRKVKLCQQLFEAINYLHQHGYLHLDIKTNNILVTAEANQIILADFGSSLYVGADQLAVKISGRERIVDYLKSPELLVDEINQTSYHYRPTDDYWSTGLTILEFFQVDLVNLDGSPEEIYRHRRKQFEDSFPSLSTVPPELIDSLKSLLSWRWVDRRLPTTTSIQIPTYSRTYRWGRYYHSSYRQDHLNYCYQFFDRQLAENGDYPVEAFFLTLDLYHRSIWLASTYSEHPKLLVTCYWLALKLSKGCRVDVREISYEDNLIKMAGRGQFSHLEQRILHHLKGQLYQPNTFTTATSFRQLLNYQPFTPIVNQSTRSGYFKGKNQVNLRLYWYYRGRIKNPYL